MNTTKIEELTHDKIQAEIAKLMAETSKINSETIKINSENRWYPAIVGATVTLAIVAVVKLYL